MKIRIIFSLSTYIFFFLAKGKLIFRCNFDERSKTKQIIYLLCCSLSFSSLALTIQITQPHPIPIVTTSICCTPIILSLLYQSLHLLLPDIEMKFHHLSIQIYKCNQAVHSVGSIKFLSDPYYEHMPSRE